MIEQDEKREIGLEIAELEAKLFRISQKPGNAQKEKQKIEKQIAELKERLNKKRIIEKSSKRLTPSERALKKKIHEEQLLATKKQTNKVR